MTVPVKLKDIIEGLEFLSAASEALACPAHEARNVRRRVSAAPGVDSQPRCGKIAFAFPIRSHRSGQTVALYPGPGRSVRAAPRLAHR
jgi:hypothetical protein